MKDLLEREFAGLVWSAVQAGKAGTDALAHAVAAAEALCLAYSRLRNVGACLTAVLITPTAEEAVAVVRHAMPRRAIPCDVAPCHAMSCHAMLCRAMLCPAMP